MIQIDDLLLSVDKGQSLIFILLAFPSVFDGSGQKLMLSCQEGVAGSKGKHSCDLALSWVINLQSGNKAHGFEALPIVKGN